MTECEMTIEDVIEYGNKYLRLQNMLGNIKYEISKRRIKGG